MNKRSIDILAGLFVVLGLLALAFLAFRAASSDGMQHLQTYRLVAYFDNVGGLKARAPVRSAGVLVGRVANIELDPQRYLARVTLDMDSRYPFPDDSSLKILTAGLLGEQYMGIDAGADDRMLKDGAEVKMTQGAVVLENLISQFLYGKASEGGESTGSGKP